MHGDDLTPAVIRVLLMEGHAMVRAGVRLLLGAAGFAVVGDAADGAGALRLLARLGGATGVDVVVTDLELPGLGGAGLVRRVKADFPGTRVLFLTMHQAPEHVLELLASGADGYVLKQAAGADLAAAVRATAAGETYLSPAIARQVLALGRGPAPEPNPLSAREREVIGLLAAGATSKEVARRLGIRPKTAENHRSRILVKLGATNAAAAIGIALRRGLLAAPDPGRAGRREARPERVGAPLGLGG